MKKRLFFLPMVAIMMAACNSNETHQFPSDRQRRDARR